MVIRLHNVSKWKLLEQGFLPFVGDHHRKIRIDVNCEVVTRFDIVQPGEGDDDDKLTMLAAGVQGLETLEFSAPADTVLHVTSEGEVWYFTNEGDDQSVPGVEDEIFTTIANRRARNPQLEMMMFKQEQNMNRRLKAQAAEFQAMIDAAGVRHDTVTGEIDDDAEAEQHSGAADGDAGGQQQEPSVPQQQPVKGGDDVSARNAVSGRNGATK